MILNAHKLVLEDVLNKFRAVAAAWGIGTSGYDNVIMAINMIKEDLVNYSLTPARVWMQTKSLFHSGKHLIPDLIQFMDAMESNTCLDYIIILEKEENPKDLLFGKL